MPKTAVGLFEDRSCADEVVREIEATGFPRYEVRTLGEPLDLSASGVMSIPRIDFEVELYRELCKMGASKTATEAYVDGLRRGGVLVFATGSKDEVDNAADIMNRHGAVEVEEEQAPQPHLHTPSPESLLPESGDQVQSGRLRHSGGGACFFVW